VFFGSHAGDQPVKRDEWVGAVTTIDTFDKIDGIFVTGW
jgi:hypothetical protein